MYDKTHLVPLQDVEKGGNEVWVWRQGGVAGTSEHELHPLLLFHAFQGAHPGAVVKHLWMAKKPEGPGVVVGTAWPMADNEAFSLGNASKQGAITRVQSFLAGCQWVLV